MTRDQILKKWINHNYGINYRLESASSDASFRRYFRLFIEDKTFILMDATPEKEPLKSYLDITKILLAEKLPVPKIFKKDIKNGFLTIEDFGDKTLLNVLNEKLNAELYHKAIDIIIKLQKINKNNNLKEYSDKVLRFEINLFYEWYIKKNKKLNLSSKDYDELINTFETIINYNKSQTNCFVHRDFHSRNLMILSENDIGIIDFQDALIGPISYDLVSLLKDAYFELDEEFIIDKTVRYWEMACDEKLLQKRDFSDFFLDFEMMGLQRHLKILGIFSRLSLRDGKHNYLDDLPLVEKYVLKTLERYSALSPLRKIFIRALNE